MHWCSVNISIDTTCDESLNWAAEKTHFNVCCCSYLLSVTTPQYCWQCSPSVIVRGQLSDLEWREDNFPGDILSSSWSRESPPWSRRCWEHYSHGALPWPALPWLSFSRYYTNKMRSYDDMSKVCIALRTLLKCSENVLRMVFLHIECYAIKNALD